MAFHLTKASIIRPTAVRTLASCTKTIPLSGIPEYSVETSTLGNQLIVASTENSSALCRISILFKAGARNENFDNLGVTHVLRIAAGLSTRNATQFAIMRNIQQVGANLTCSTDREVVAYTLEGTREAVTLTLPYLTEVATEQVFRPWEIEDNIPRLKLELQIRSPQLRAIDLLHKAAYRSCGLGNSLFIAKHQVGKISSETLQHYVCQNFLSSRTAVAGVGIPHSKLVAYASELQVDTGKDATEKSPYLGGEIRSDKGGNLAYIAIAGEGGSLSNAKEALSFAILQHIFGAGPSIKYGKESLGLISKCLGTKAGGSSLRAFNANYSDSGLFGVLICAPADYADKAAIGAVSILKNNNVTQTDLDRGKAQLKRALLFSLESGANIVENIGVQALLKRHVSNPTDISLAIDDINIADVQKAAQKVKSSKLSIASVGNLGNVPFLDELQ